MLLTWVLILNHVFQIVIEPKTLDCKVRHKISLHDKIYMFTHWYTPVYWQDVIHIRIKHGYTADQTALNKSDMYRKNPISDIF